MIDLIVNQSLLTNKHIWIIGSARSGTHALGSTLAEHNPKFKYLQEICCVDGRPEPWNDIKIFQQHKDIFIGQTVGFTSKVFLTSQVAQIKKHALIVNIKRQDKISQFASWMYFNTTNAPFEIWHNHLSAHTLIKPNTITVTETQIEQFIIEQTIDDFFLPDFVVCYEDFEFKNSKYKKNEFSFDLKNIFTNLDFVEKYLKDWHYTKEHFAGAHKEH